MPADGYGLTLLLHSLDANYNQFLASNNQSQFGERGPGSIVITAEGRGPDGWYYDYAGADTFEVWADVAARYRLDPDWTAIAGYSMGGYGTYKFATQFPDLFAKAQPTVGPPGLGIWAPPSDPQPGGAQSNTNRMLGSVRNIPFLMWNAAQDELVPVAERAGAGGQPRRARLPLRVRPVQPGRPPHARRQRRVRAGGRASSARRRSTATRRTSPTPTTRRWTSRPSRPRPATRTGSRE